MPTSKVHTARTAVPAATASKSTKASAQNPATAKAKSGSTEGQSASELIDKRIAELGDWRGET